MNYVGHLCLGGVVVVVVLRKKKGRSLHSMEGIEANYFHVHQTNFI
jgi:hypothetical protein